MNNPELQSALEKYWDAKTPLMERIAFARIERLKETQELPLEAQGA